MFETNEDGMHSVESVAKLIGITDRRIRQLSKDEAVPKVVRGKIHLVQTVQAYCNYLRNLGGTKNADYHEERARLTKLKADAVESDNRARDEGWLSVDAVESLMVENNTAIRTRLLGVPGKWAASSPDATVDAVGDLDNLIREALGDAASTKPPKDLISRLTTR